MEPSKTRIVTLTDRPPVKIVDADWPMLASAKWHDGKVECEANRSCWIKVRQHADGRTLVYGGRESCFLNERDLRGGELLTPAGEGALTPDDGRTVESAEIVAAIRRVAATVRAEEIAADCIADLPAEVL